MSEQASSGPRVRGWLWLIVKIAVPVVGVGAVFYWMRYAPLPISQFEVAQGPISAEVMGTGTLEARVSTTVSPKISGRISTVAVDQGEQVSQGDPLFRLDAEELLQQVAIAEANVDAARAAIVRLQADKARTEAVLEQTTRTRSRFEELLKQSATSREEFERATEAMAVAVADLARSEAAISEGQKQLLAAEKTLEYHRARLEDTNIAAPFDGLIVARHREAGDVVVPGSDVLTLISTDVLWIRAWVDETQMSAVDVDQPARIVFRSEPQRSFAGKVSRLGKESDRETREFVVDVEVFELPDNWAVGQRADIFLQTAHKPDALTIPAEYLVNKAGGPAVFVNEVGVARLRPVTLGLRSRDMVEVVEGLSVGDQVVAPLNQANQLSDGRRIIDKA